MVDFLNSSPLKLGSLVLAFLCPFVNFCSSVCRQVIISEDLKTCPCHRPTTSMHKYGKVHRLGRLQA